MSDKDLMMRGMANSLALAVTDVALGVFFFKLGAGLFGAILLLAALMAAFDFSRFYNAHRSE
jgi:hypothetical protein